MLHHFVLKKNNLKCPLFPRSCWRPPSGSCWLATSQSVPCKLQRRRSRFYPATLSRDTNLHKVESKFSLGSTLCLKWWNHSHPFQKRAIPSKWWYAGVTMSTQRVLPQLRGFGFVGKHEDLKLSLFFWKSILELQWFWVVMQPHLETHGTLSCHLTLTKNSARIYRAWNLFGCNCSISLPMFSPYSDVTHIYIYLPVHVSSWRSLFGQALKIYREQEDSRMKRCRDLATRIS